ncbi:NAD(P)/FAD-dependent oxidoreductase [Acinetobacter johnsonii]|uniref:NAD(P)/FAD-dependent oxidoreductase n=1 Tax=Acinetobacter TaxID=469 RepID=UPI001321130F|nr:MULTISPECIES: FAD-dependent oxidoreductase [Acinetobacter]MWC18539.1 NAD(P)/FAD-dependent oxidoreductase [Acinetobacter johnsonii]NAR64590.1 NAD(P)/FAD-dependent oxidoreductase [Acinetobacter haemolyticus]
MSNYDVIIVGTGHAGAQAAVALRQQGFTGSILMIGEESHLPYERPPLSKEYFSGEKAFERILLRPEQFWRDKNISLELGQRVTRIDAQSHRLFTHKENEYGYATLIWATGGKPRRLSCEGADLQGIHYIRNREDVDRIQQELDQVEKCVVIGGGYIGLEAASALRKIDREVTLVEAQSRVLARVAGATISDFYQNYHQAKGVKLYLGQGVDYLEGEQGRVTSVVLADGSRLATDLVIVGVGLNPEVEALVEAGANFSNGIETDRRCHTSLPDIFAIGDCANHENVYADGQRIRLESVQNANDQAVLVAKEIMYKGEDYVALPWFWSNQYDLKLQTIGLSMGFDQELLRGDLESGSFTVMYLRQGKVIALDCVNRPADFIQGKAMIQHKLTVPIEQLKNHEQSFKEMINQYQAH